MQERMNHDPLERGYRASRSGLTHARARQHRYPSIVPAHSRTPVETRAHEIDVKETQVDCRPAASPRLIRRMKQRKLIQWLLGYIAAAWMALQLTDSLREIWDWPVGFQRGVTLVLGLGVLPALVIAWYHGEKGRQAVCVPELVILCGLLFGSAVLIWQVCA